METPSFAIRIHNRTQKLAALLLLQQFMGAKISPSILYETLMNKNALAFPYVYCASSDNYVTATSHPTHFTKIIEYTDNLTLDGIRDQLNPLPPTLILEGKYNVVFQENGKIKFGGINCEFERLEQIYNTAKEVRERE